MKRHDLVRWENPPPARPQGNSRTEEDGGVWRDVAERLRSRPGEWAVVKESPSPNAVSSLVAAIKFGLLVDFRPVLDFDATSRSIAGKGVVYARYAPGDAE